MLFPILLLIIPGLILILAARWAKSDPGDMVRRVACGYVQVMCLVAMTLGVVWFAVRTTDGPSLSEMEASPLLTHHRAAAPQVRQAPVTYWAPPNPIQPQPDPAQQYPTTVQDAQANQSTSAALDPNHNWERPVQPQGPPPGPDATSPIPPDPSATPPVLPPPGSTNQPVSDSSPDSNSNSGPPGPPSGDDPNPQNAAGSISSA